MLILQHGADLIFAFWGTIPLKPGDSMRKALHTCQLEELLEPDFSQMCGLQRAPTEIILLFILGLAMLLINSFLPNLYAKF